MNAGGSGRKCVGHPFEGDFPPTGGNWERKIRAGLIFELKGTVRRLKRLCTGAIHRLRKTVRKEILKFGLGSWV